MSMRYAGGIISATPPTVTTSSAQGMWTLSEQAQYKKAGVWPNALAPTTIGQAFGGGFYAGQISTSGDGVATHYLIVAPKASGQSYKTWGTYGVATGVTSKIAGPTNTASLVALGAAYQAAIFCNDLNAGSGLNGYTDWYMPAKNELEVLYYNLKPTTATNYTSSGANTNAVLPEPYNTNYTSGSPAQTTVTGVNGFRTGETNAFASDYYWSSTENDSNDSWLQIFGDGMQYGSDPKNWGYYVRAVRRIAV